MSGETDLNRILGHLTVTRRPGTFTFVTVDEAVSPAAGIDAGIDAVIAEPEGTTVITTVEIARERGWDVDFEGAWLTLDVHSSLDLVGLTAAVSAAFAADGIPCNVVAGYYHDHLLVPVDRVDDAMRAIAAMRST